MMSNSRLVWTDEMKNTLLRYWQAGMDHTEIADRMGLKMEQISSALQRARRGEWGGEYASRYSLARSSTLDETVAEADARGMTYGQLQTERRLAEVAAEIAEPETAEDDAPATDDNSHNAIVEIMTQVSSQLESETAENEPIDMLAAINDLVRCSITQNTRITAVSAVEGQFADIAFVRCGSTYVLSLRREDQE